MSNSFGMPYRDDRLAWKSWIERLEGELADARWNAKAAEQERRRLEHELAVLRARWSPGEKVMPRSVAFALVFGLAAAAMVASALGFQSRTNATHVPVTPPATFTATPVPIVPIPAWSARPVPLEPTRRDIQAGMAGVAGAVRACGGGVTGTATIRVTVAGTGRVTTAAVTGSPFAGTPAGACMARAARGATMPPFDRPSVTINYPFVIR